MIDVTIKNNSTGEVKTVSLDLEWRGDFIWREGSLSCDCNRHDFFCLGDDDNDLEYPCGDSGFTVLSIKRNGVEVYSERLEK
jgi:hypothetical protein